MPPFSTRFTPTSGSFFFSSLLPALRTKSDEVSPSHRRQGVMTEAIKEVNNFCFKTLRLPRVVIDPLETNPASLALAQTLGFKPVGTKRSVKGTQNIFELTREDWDKGRKAKKSSNKKKKKKTVDEGESAMAAAGLETAADDPPQVAAGAEPFLVGGEEPCCRWCVPLLPSLPSSTSHPSSRLTLPITQVSSPFDNRHAGLLRLPLRFLVQSTVQNGRFDLDQGPRYGLPGEAEEVDERRPTSSGVEGALCTILIGFAKSRFLPFIAFSQTRSEVGSICFERAPLDSSENGREEDYEKGEYRCGKKTTKRKERGEKEKGARGVRLAAVRTNE
jgi:hypothetical protein